MTVIFISLHENKSRLQPTHTYHTLVLLNPPALAGGGLVPELSCPSHPSITYVELEDLIRLLGCLKSFSCNIVTIQKNMLCLFRRTKLYQKVYLTDYIVFYIFL